MMDTHSDPEARFVVVEIDDETLAAIVSVALLHAGFIPVQPGEELDLLDLVLSLPPGRVVVLTVEPPGGSDAPSCSWTPTERGQPPTLRLQAKEHEPGEPPDLRPIPDFACMVRALRMPTAS